jgi:hypothetical protein
MFSTRPRTGSESFLVKDRDFIVSLSAVVWGVVMRTEEGVVGLSVVGLKRGCRCVKREMCSSDVPKNLVNQARGATGTQDRPDLPGGVSMTR